MYVKRMVQIFKTQLNYQNNADGNIPCGVLVSHYCFLWDLFCILTLSFSVYRQYIITGTSNCNTSYTLVSSHNIHILYACICICIYWVIKKSCAPAD
jgi:hypothetical protein